MTLKNHRLICEISNLIEHRREAQINHDDVALARIEKQIEEKSALLRSCEDHSQDWKNRKHSFCDEAIIYALNHGYTVRKIKNDFSVSIGRIERIKEKLAQ